MIGFGFGGSTLYQADDSCDVDTVQDDCITSRSSKKLKLCNEIAPLTVQWHVVPKRITAAIGQSYQTRAAISSNCVRVCNGGNP